MKKISIPTILLISIVSYCALIVFIQNFLLVDFSTLNYYEIDDAAFHQSLQAYVQKYGKDMLFMNDYGYGWIFWSSMCIITFPARLIFQNFNISWPLIVTPRMYALFFAVSCSIVAYKIIGKYTQNKWIRLAVVISLPMFPAGARFAGRFSTVSVGSFFAMLAIWLIIRRDTLERKDLRCALLCFAIAMGIKLSAVVAAPILVLLILNRYDWKITKKNLKIWLSESLLAVVAMVFFISPAILFYPFATEQAKASINVILNYMKANQSYSSINSLFDVISFTNYDIIGMLFCILLVALVGVGIYGVFVKKSKDLYLKDYIVIPVGFAAGLLYLCITVNTALDYRYMYANAILFVAPMGLIVLQHIVPRKETIKNAFIMGICIICTIGQLLYIRNQDILLNYTILAQKSEQQIETIRPIKEAIEKTGLQSVAMLSDYRSPYMVYNSFENDNVIYSYCIWDNLHEWQLEDTNIIMLSKLAQGSQPEQAFDEAVASFDEQKKENAYADRDARKQLIEQGVFNQKNWIKIYEDEFSYVFVREDAV